MFPSNLRVACWLYKCLFIGTIVSHDQTNPSLHFYIMTSSVWLCKTKTILFRDNLVLLYQDTWADRGFTCGYGKLKSYMHHWKILSYLQRYMEHYHGKAAAVCQREQQFSGSLRSSKNEGHLNGWALTSTLSRVCALFLQQNSEILWLLLDHGGALRTYLEELWNYHVHITDDI